MSLPPQILVPFDRREAITIRSAEVIAGVSASTLRTWCDQHHIGRRIAGGPWQVSRPALQMLLDGNKEALTRYLAGERSGLVADYFRAVGLGAVALTLQRAQSSQDQQSSHGTASRIAASLALKE